MTPEVGCWYKVGVDGDPFEIIAVDQDAEIIDIEYLNGIPEEMSLEDWEEHVEDEFLMLIDEPPESSSKAEDQDAVELDEDDIDEEDPDEEEEE